MCERISYFGSEDTQSDIASLYSLAKAIVDERVVRRRASSAPLLSSSAADECEQHFPLIFRSDTGAS
jgi:hypothetical protein